MLLDLLRPDLDAIRNFVQSALLQSTQPQADAEGAVTFINDNCESFFGG